MKEEPINECPVPNGILVIIGGHEDKGEEPAREVNKKNEEPLSVLKTFISLIKSENPVLEIFTTASAQGDELFAEYTKAFRELGIKNIGHIHHDNREQILEDSERYIERINKADAVFLAGEISSN